MTESSPFMSDEIEDWMDAWFWEEWDKLNEDAMDEQAFGAP